MIIIIIIVVVVVSFEYEFLVELEFKLAARKHMSAKTIAAAAGRN